MNNDQRLEELLRNTGRIEVPQPDGVGDRTVQRLYHSWQPTPKQKRLSVIKNIGIVVAACLLLMVGYFSTTGMLDWLTANQDRDYLSDPRIAEVQDQVPFPLALPPYLPRDYSLSDVDLEWHMDSSDPKVIMSFSGPTGYEPITITQATVMELNVYDPAGLSYVNISSPDLDYYIGSEDFGWGGARADMGYYYENVVDGRFTMARTLVLIVRDSDGAEPGYSYVTISTGSPVKPFQGKVADADDILAIAQGIVDAKVELISPGEEGLWENWPLVMPAHLPPGFNLRSMSLRGYTGPHYYGKLEYATENGSDTLYIQQQQVREELGAPLRAEDVQLSTSYFPITGYYYYLEEDATQVLCFNIPGEWVNEFDVITESALVDKEVLTDIAQSIAGQYTRPQAPTQEYKKFNIEPTSHSLTFGPKEDTLIAYVPAEGEIARLWVGGTRHDLPGVPLLSDYGPVWWRGETFAYHVVGNRDEGPGIFYVYDTSDHTYTKVEAMADWDHGIKKPVILADGSIAVLAPGGLWTYNLADQSWELLWTIKDYQDITEITWSPDGTKVAWVVLGAKEELIGLDVASGSQEFIYDGAAQKFQALAWSSDSRNLAAAINHHILVWDGTEMVELQDTNDRAFTGNLSWVPGTDMISYTRGQSLHLWGKMDDHRGWTSGMTDFWGEGDPGNHAWLANGNLAVVQDLPDEGIAEVTIYGWD